jgi:hypothetical protein
MNTPNEQILLDFAKRYLTPDVVHLTRLGDYKIDLMSDHVRISKNGHDVVSIFPNDGSVMYHRAMETSGDLRTLIAKELMALSLPKVLTTEEVLGAGRKFLTDVPVVKDVGMFKVDVRSTTITIKKAGADYATLFFIPKTISIYDTFGTLEQIYAILMEL